MFFAIPHVHAVQLVGEQRRLFAARARADFKRAIAFVVFILRQQQNLQFAEKNGELFLARLRFVEQQTLHFARFPFRLFRRRLHFLFAARIFGVFFGYIVKFRSLF